MTTIPNGNLVGRCGLYCGACVIYRAQRDDQAWRARIAERNGCAVQNVQCNGCGALAPESWGNNCKFAICLNEHGFTYCYECPEFEARSCRKYENFAKEYLEDEGVDLRANLDMIKAGKSAQWLEQMASRYTCPHCDLPTAIGAPKCHHCKRQIPS
jgi:hypothetical protein